jgi:uncharacterized GH25 family protein
MNARQSTRFILSALFLLAAAPAGAHEYWIEPAAFRPAVGAKVPLRLYVGQDFRGESQIFLPELFRRYAVLDPGGERAVTGTAGDDPAGHFTPARAGLHVVVYHSSLATVNFESRAEFERYLDKEGLEGVRALPGYERLVNRKPIRERYSRCAKSLVSVGPAADADRVVGLPLELVAERNPAAGGPRGDFPVRLLLHGEPLPGALVIAFQRTSPLTRLSARTDADGRARLPLARPGPWLVSAVHLAPAPRLAREEWESLWASLTFELTK